MTKPKIKMKRMLTVVALYVQNVTTQWFVEMLPTAGVTFAKTTYVFVRA
jgi:hypothetical protein